MNIPSFYGFPKVLAILLLLIPPVPKTSLYPIPCCLRLRLRWILPIPILTWRIIRAWPLRFVCNPHQSQLFIYSFLSFELLNLQLLHHLYNLVHRLGLVTFHHLWFLLLLSFRSRQSIFTTISHFALPQFMHLRILPCTYFQGLGFQGISHIGCHCGLIDIDIASFA